ncbi:heterokaryon incompatibility protein-domain-containing protein [Xylogone sp. PMI_703]|nr:heterokaryon incompatibility protein-domain-containing protein [Xylogone sp. PMI_703]
MFSIDSPGQYLAISYVWGAALKPFSIQTPKGNIALTVSLHDALQSIRDREVSTLLWVDAICIDQEVAHEKSIQIRLMRTIFQSAENVIAWLGNEKDNSDRAIETLMQIRMIALKPDSWPEGLPAVPVSWGGRNTPSPTDITWKEIDLLLSRDWFRRSWIVQELILASNVIVVCGKWTLDWEEFFEAVKICREAMKLEEAQPDSGQAFVLNHSDPAYALGLMRQSRLTLSDYIFGRKYNLLELMGLFSYTKATRQRDKLFSLLGLAGDCNETVFDPDYDSPLQVVIQRYANEFVRRGQAMELLYRAGISKSYRFCSWIPFWTGEDFPRTISTWRSALGNYCAGGKEQPQAQLLPTTPSTLVVKGFSLDTIIRVSDIRINEVDIVTFVNSIYSAIDSLKSVSTGESRQELKLKLPIGGAIRPCSESTSGLQVIEDAELKQENWPLNLGSKMATVGTIQEFMNFLKMPEHSRDVVWKYWQTAAAFAKRLSNGTFCVTKRGYAGMVPGAAQVGDEVCIFTGGNVPFILRKGESQEEKITYRLIGEAYIHGFMHGEALSFKHTSKQGFHLV